MTSIEYNNLIDCLYRGHDIVFLYKDQHYFLEQDNSCHNLYKASANLDKSEFIKKFDGDNLIVRINAFLEIQLFDGKSFNEIYSIIDIVDIE